MSYIRETLSPEEKLIFYTHPHYVIFYQVLMWFVLALFMYVVIASVFLGVLLIVMGVGSFISSLIGYYFSEYGITSRRVIMKVGFIRRRSLELFLERVEGVSVDQSVFGRILNYGAVTIIGVGGTRNRFFFIPNPIQFRNELQQQLVKIGSK